MKILVTGGAGYIGSIMTKRLLDSGKEVLVVDDLERGYREAVDPRGEFLEGNLLDSPFVEKIFTQHHIESVVHFAGYISMGESMENPAVYFQNNVYATLNVLEAMRKHTVSRFIFSSTAGVYGNPEKTPIPEDHPKNPTNPYGESKLMVERVLSWYQKLFGINFIALRYFNAAGALPDSSLGEEHEPETHIIPIAIRSILENTQFPLYGTDYKTPDGTAVRDYIHVTDLVEAHMLSLAKLENSQGGFFYNVGTGKGWSNKEVLEMVGKITGKEVSIKNNPRRLGDAEILVADSSRIKNELGFTPQHSDLQTIVESAWNYYKKNAK